MTAAETLLLVLLVGRLAHFDSWPFLQRLQMNRTDVEGLLRSAVEASIVEDARRVALIAVARDQQNTRSTPATRFPPRRDNSL